MTPSERLLPQQQQHQRPSLPHPQQQPSQQHQHPPDDYFNHQHNNHHHQHSSHSHSHSNSHSSSNHHHHHHNLPQPYPTPLHNDAPLHSPSHHSGHNSPTASRPPCRHRASNSFDTGSDRSYAVSPGSVYAPPSHHLDPAYQDTPTHWQQQHPSSHYPDRSPDRSSHSAQSSYTAEPYYARDHPAGPRTGPRDRSTQPYLHHSRQHSGSPMLTTSSHFSSHDPPLHSPLPHDRSWNPSASSNPHDLLSEPVSPMTHMHQPAAPLASERRYILTSGAPTSSAITQRRFSVSHQSGSCLTLEPMTVAPALPAMASTSVLSPPHASSSSSSSSPGQRHPAHVHDSYMFNPLQGREGTLRMQPKIPPRIRTQLSKDSCPPLTHQSLASGRSLDGKMSPSTPRSSFPAPIMTSHHQLHGHEIPMGYEPIKMTHPATMDHHHHHHHHRHLYTSPVTESYRDDHDMEHCSEQDDVHDREDDEGDDDDDEGVHVKKVTKVNSSMDSKDNRPHPHRSARPTHHHQEADELDNGNSAFPSSSNSRKPGTPPQEETKTKKSRGKIASPKGKTRHTSLPAADDAEDEEGQGQDVNGAPPQGKGLGFYAPLVCKRVEKRGRTTYNDLVNDLAGHPPERADGTAAAQEPGQGNIRRRVYDALNILESLGIIEMDKKEIRWVGIQEARDIVKLSERIQQMQLQNEANSASGAAAVAEAEAAAAATATAAATAVAAPPNQPPEGERDGSDESEEPEDDDMDIEQLQREVEGMRIRNAMEMACLQDQVARNVQVNNLIERNRQREQKELERELRRRRRKHKEEKRAAAAAAAAANGEAMDVQEGSSDPSANSGEPMRRSERRHHRHHRHHRSPHPEREGETDCEMQHVGGTEGEMDEEAARQNRKKERRERRERRDRRERRRIEKEMAAEARENEERIQLPFAIVRVPGYGSQGSDSEASIKVVRSVREERPRKSGKSKRHSETTSTRDETTMVRITIPHQEELSIVSDTEILSDLGLNEVPLNELREMLPQEALDNAGYTTTSMETDGSTDNVVVRGGFERALRRTLRAT